MTSHHKKKLELPTTSLVGWMMVNDRKFLRFYYNIKILIFYYQKFQNNIFCNKNITYECALCQCSKGLKCFFLWQSFKFSIWESWNVNIPNSYTNKRHKRILKYYKKDAVMQPSWVGDLLIFYFRTPRAGCSKAG